MPMTPNVAAARLRHKAKKTITSIFIGVVLLFLFWAFASMAVKVWKEHKADSDFRHGLVVSSEKSPAHHFLVTNWLHCRPLLQTRASCYASIRGAAASYGDSFVHQVDAAARELELI